jgi:hypothetical protein
MKKHLITLLFPFGAVAIVQAEVVPRYVQFMPDGPIIAVSTNLMEPRTAFYRIGTAPDFLINQKAEILPAVGLSAGPRMCTAISSLHQCAHHCLPSLPSIARTATCRRHLFRAFYVNSLTFIRVFAQAELGQHLASGISGANGTVNKICGRPGGQHRLPGRDPWDPRVCSRPLWRVNPISATDPNVDHQ